MKPVARPFGLLVAAAALCLFASGTAHADTRAGLLDFERGAFAEAYQEWRAAADAGDARGALYIGVLYDSGEGMAHDPVQAMQWYRRAADGGIAAGAFNVAVLYDSGNGVARDPANAIAWYSRAADAGYGRADYNLGLIYDSGDGVARDRVRATTFFQRAARQGIAAARTHLPRANLASLERPTGPAGGAEDQATRDFALAQQLLLTRGPAEAAKAADLFSQAADHQNALAEYDLAYCYQNGLGVPRNLARADALYRRAATHAHDEYLRSIAMTAAQTLGSGLTATTSTTIPR